MAVNDVFQTFFRFFLSIELPTQFVSYYTWIQHDNFEFNNRFLRSFHLLWQPLRFNWANIRFFLCQRFSTQKTTRRQKYKNKYHSVIKSQKNSHSTLRAKRDTFTFWVDKSSFKNANSTSFENLKFVVKQCYQIDQF